MTACHRKRRARIYGECPGCEVGEGFYCLPSCPDQQNPALDEPHGPIINAVSGRAGPLEREHADDWRGGWPAR